LFAAIKRKKLIPTNPMLGLSPMFYQEHFISKSVSYKPGDMLETAFKCHCPNNFPEDDVTLVIAKLK